MAIEIVDFPINSMVIFHSYVNVYQWVSVYSLRTRKSQSGKKVHQLFLWAIFMGITGIWDLETLIFWQMLGFLIGVEWDEMR